jgi:hypothetical protein
VAFKAGKKTEGTPTPMGRESNDAKDGMDNPVVEDLPCGITGIAHANCFRDATALPVAELVASRGQKMLSREWSRVPQWFVRFLCIPLYNAHEVIDIDVVLMDRGLEWGQQQRGLRH